MAPFVLGDLSSAAEVHIHESQWDLLAHADVIDFDTENQGIGLVATRGSANGGLAGVVNKLEAKNYLWPQRDIADEKGKIPAKEWLRQVQATLRRAAYVCWIPDLAPDRNFDFNDWHRSGKIDSDNLEQIMGEAELFEPPAAEKKLPPFAAGLQSAYGTATGESKDSQKHSSRQTEGGENGEFEESEKARAEGFGRSVAKGPDLLKINIPPRTTIIDDWFKEGDLGFLFAPRGVGKTWLVTHLCAALSEGSKFGLWKVVGKWPVLYVDGEMSLEDDKERTLGLNDGKIPENLYVLNHEALFGLEGLVMNLANRRDQKILTNLCLEKSIKVLVLDNLGCLFTGVSENDADEWEKVLPWLLELRRHRIAVIIVHHTGHDPSKMRGTSKREDSAAWVLRLDDKKEDYSEAGAVFISRFRKYRGKKVALDCEWKFTPNGDRVLVTFREAYRADIVLQWVADGLTGCDDIAKEMGITKGTVSKIATRLIKAGKLKRKGRNYELA